MHAEIADLLKALAVAVGEAEGTAGEENAWKAVVFLDRLLFSTARRRRGGTRGQRGESLSHALGRRLRLAWQGSWAVLWQESSAAVGAGLASSPPDGERLARDVRAIEEALAAEDAREALRCVDGRASMASDAEARRCLPQLFPQAAQALRPPAATEPDSADLERFEKEL
eukprot:7515190-Alexandrium_andersonii.AAC.1